MKMRHVRVSGNDNLSGHCWTPTDEPGELVRVPVVLGRQVEGFVYLDDGQMLGLQLADDSRRVELPLAQIVDLEPVSDEHVDPPAIDQTIDVPAPAE